MGCDIHVHIEYKDKNSDVWKQYDDPWLCRNYTLFAVLAGVRNYDDQPVQIAPRGLPDDMSDETREDAGVIDDFSFHTPGWLTAKEVETLLMPRFENLPLDWVYVLGSLTGLSLIGDARLVFWFDN